MQLARVLTARLSVLASFCGVALALGGCADGVHGLTGPSTTTSISGLAARSPEEAALVPFRGDLEAIDTDTVSFPFLSVHLTGSGNATHLGSYTAVFDFRVDLRPPPTPAVGSFTLTGASGDSLSGGLIGLASIAKGIATVVETATITGGTGRFAKATGSFIVTRTVVQATGVSSGSFDGTIDLHN